jgi:hypothetical protein
MAFFYIQLQVLLMLCAPPMRSIENILLSLLNMHPDWPLHRPKDPHHEACADFCGLALLSDIQFHFSA